MSIQKDVRKLSNKKLLYERKVMGKIRDPYKEHGKTFVQHMDAEIKRRKEAGTMKRSANYKKKQSGFGFLL